MTTTNLPTRNTHNENASSAHEKQNGHTHEHAAQARDAQLAVAEGQQLLQSALHSSRIEEGDNTLHDEKQRDSGEQVGKMECQCRSRAGYFRPGSLRYLKNSPSGLTTKISPSLPSERSYACRLR